MLVCTALLAPRTNCDWSQTVSMRRSLGSAMPRSTSVVPSVESPAAMTNSSQMGSAERIDSTTG